MVYETRKWKDMMNEKAKYDDRNDCSVVALANVLGWEYFDAWQAMKSVGRKQYGGAYNSQTRTALVQNDVAFTHFNKAHFKLLTEDMKGKRLTVNKCRQLLSKSAKYLISIRGHIFAMTDGEVHDFENSGRHEVIGIVEVFAQQRDTLVRTDFPEPFKGEQLTLI